MYTYTYITYTKCSQLYTRRNASMYHTPHHFSIKHKKFMAVNLFLSLLFVVNSYVIRIFNLSKHEAISHPPNSTQTYTRAVFFPFSSICLNWISFIMKNHDNFTIFSLSSYHFCPSCSLASFSVSLPLSSPLILFLALLLFVFLSRPPFRASDSFAGAKSQFTDTNIRTKICCQMPTHSRYHRTESNAIIQTVRK